MDSFASMTWEQTAIFAILLATMTLFFWGRWRHDLVAGAALLACVFAGLVPGAEAFAGFGHPAVITVACVLVLSAGLQHSGAIDSVTRRLLPANGGAMAGIVALTLLAALLSGFMNNVGALALLMPVAVQMARKHDLPPGRVLMPLAFGSILGGLTTQIGTPPNLIVSGFRAEAGLGSFGMFDFTPVGLAVAAVGLLFLVTLGWRLVPDRGSTDNGGFDTGSYFTEVQVEEKSKAVGQTLRQVESTLEEADAQIVALVRNDLRISAPGHYRKLRSGDILVIEAEPETLADVLSRLGLVLAESAESTDKGSARDGASAVSDDNEQSDREETLLQEVVVMPGSAVIGRSATDIKLRSRYSLNLLAISRQGSRSIRRLRSTGLKAGDVLLLQGAAESLSGFANHFGCVPLAERDIRVPEKGRALQAGLIMAAAIVVTALGWLPVSVAFATAVLAYLLLRIVSPNTVYQAVDWPVIVLLAALIPVAGAMASTGAADLLAGVLLEQVAQGNPVLALALILVVTMTLSDFMNNAATAAVMCPIALSAAGHLGVQPDAFLMAVAIGASCAFLTPIGHQNNTLILGPGGFRFGDYWRLGLPLEILIVLVSLPMLLWVWPL